VKTTLCRAPRLWRVVMLTFLVISPLSAFPGLEFGVNLDNSTTMIIDGNDESLTYRQRDVLAGWLSYRLTGDTFLNMMSSVTFSVDDPLLVDLDLLNINGSYSFLGRNDVVLGLEAGRFGFSDFTGEVFQHTLDGGVIHLDYPRFTVRMGTGYTGFIQRLASGVKISTADRIDLGDEDLQFGPARFVTSLDLSLPEFAARQTATVGFLSQIDLRPDDDGDRVNTQYLGVGLKGPVFLGLFYDVYGIFGFGSSEDTALEEEINSRAYAANLRYYLPVLLGSRFAAGAFYGSGDDGSLTRFVPVTPRTYGTVAELEPGNLTVLSAGYSLRPFSFIRDDAMERFQLGIDGKWFFRSADDFIAAQGFNPDSDETYLGHELTGKINVRPFSDVGASFTLGAFYPNTGKEKPFFKDQRDVDFLARFEISIAL
jgi:hypothetical protein